MPQPLIDDGTGREDLPLDLLHSLRVYPDIRAKLHSVLALYAHSPPQRRIGHLDEIEWMVLEMAGRLAEELLEAGWRPGA